MYNIHDGIAMTVLMNRLLHVDEIIGPQSGIGTPNIRSIVNPNIWFVSTGGVDTHGGKDPRDALRTIQKAINLSSAYDIICVGPGSYDETVTVNKNGLVIMGLGGRGSAYIAPTTVGAEGMQVTGREVTLINLGVAGEATADYALNLHGNISIHADGVRQFRAYGCKFEGVTGTNKPAVLLDGDDDDNVGDSIFEDCEFAWSTVGLQVKASGFGTPTQIYVKNCLFHNMTTACINEFDADAYVQNLVVTDCVFESSDAGAEPTDWIIVDHASSTGLFSGNRFATATNAPGVLTIGAQIMWVANATEAGWSTARPT